MPQSLEQLDLLLLTVAKPRIIRRDGIHFQGLRYIDTTLAAYIGEQVIVRYDPRDIAEIRVFYRQRFLCRAVCQELAGETVSLKDIGSLGFHVATKLLKKYKKLVLSTCR